MPSRFHVLIVRLVWVGLIAAALYYLVPGTRPASIVPAMPATARTEMLHASL